MNCDGLPQAYWSEQIARVEKLRAKIAARPQVGNGNVVPDDDDLSLGQGRRLDMAVMFIDICGFSSRGMESVEEQDVMLRVLNLFFTEMVRIAEDYGGNVEKNTGDGLMIYFNDNEGAPPEKGAKRAVACALTMMATNEKLITPILKTTQVKELSFRASIDSGTVTVAKIGAARRFNSVVAIGATANFASKMLRHAGPDDIVLGEFARNQLPELWKSNWTQLMAIETGWYLRATGRPYGLFKYSGRWNQLV